MMNDEERVAHAVELFRSGCNCAQAVVAAFADRYGYTADQAKQISVAFGGGIGRMRLTCGAACGLFMLAGMETTDPATDPKTGKQITYDLVQQLAAEFKSRNGSLTCAELLGLARGIDPETGQPVARRPKKPCAQIVEEAARIWVERLRTMSAERDAQ